MFLSRNLDQNMHKIALFLEKKMENRRSVGGSAPKPPSCYSHHLLRYVCTERERDRGFAAFAKKWSK